MTYLETAASKSSGKGTDVEKSVDKTVNGIVSSIYGFFGWAAGSSVTARTNVLTIYGKLDTVGKSEAYADAVYRYGGTSVVGNSPAEFEQRLKEGKLDNQAFELNKAMYNSDSEQYRDAASALKLTPSNIAVTVAADGIKAGTDVILSTTSTIAPGFGDGVATAQKIIKVANDPTSVITDRADKYFKTKTGMSTSNVGIALNEIKRHVNNAKKRTGSKTESDILKEGGTGKVTAKDTKGTTPGNVAGTVVQNTDRSKTHIAIKSTSSLTSAPAKKSVKVVADNTAGDKKNTVISSSDVDVAEGSETTVTVNYPSSTSGGSSTVGGGGTSDVAGWGGDANGWYVSYSISGVALEPRKNPGTGAVERYTYEGKLTGNTLSISGRGWTGQTISGPSYPGYIKASITVGSQTKNFEYIAVTAGEHPDKSFSLSLPIPEDASNASFSMSMVTTNAYKDQGVVVSGSLKR